MTPRDEKKIFELGERRKVSLHLWLDSGYTWTPENPSWELISPDGATAASGTAEAVQTAEGWTLSTLCEPTGRGLWRLCFAFDLGEEHVKRSALIKVV